ncbi:hypothetical protein BGP89_11385 [Luteimonas sp. JM171]|uniref:hypothetical protein n=1 Tax=Luteimonas sp. JM171 TaxID=1896164 RepID=UPI0008569DE6|nr:hypothetical protein [Luteimonas sp. JM171]AOH36882.1 hypothetical protein BGP89_11385 [Luteimonas sp. JM171]
MAGYYEGVANGFAELKAVLESALVLNGWSDSSGIFSKGGMFVRLDVAPGGNGLDLNAGTGQSGSTLNGAATFPVRIHSFMVADPIAWPVTYELHVSEAPDEVYLIVNYNVDRVQTLAFGRSPAPGNGTGYWINGSGGPGTNFSHANTGYQWNGQNFNALQSVAPSSGNQDVAAGVLAAYLNSGDNQRSYRYHRDGWKPDNNAAGLQDGGVSGGTYALSLLRSLPSQANQGMVLVPAYLFECASDNRSIPALQLHHLRHCRIDNYNIGDVVEFGPDRWKVYPIGRKDLANRTPGSSGGGERLLHTGTYGFAVRYHGP